MSLYFVGCRKCWVSKFSTSHYGNQPGPQLLRLQGGSWLVGLGPVTLSNFLSLWKTYFFLSFFFLSFFLSSFLTLSVLFSKEKILKYCQNPCGIPNISRHSLQYYFLVRCVFSKYNTLYHEHCSDPQLGSLLNRLNQLCLFCTRVSVSYNFLINMHNLRISLTIHHRVLDKDTGSWHRAFYFYFER